MSEIQKVGGDHQSGSHEENGIGVRDHNGPAQWVPHDVAVLTIVSAATAGWDSELARHINSPFHSCNPLGANRLDDSPADARDPPPSSFGCRNSRQETGVFRPEHAAGATPQAPPFFGNQVTLGKLRAVAYEFRAPGGDRSDRGFEGTRITRTGRHVRRGHEETVVPIGRAVPVCQIAGIGIERADRASVNRRRNPMLAKNKTFPYLLAETHPSPGFLLKFWVARVSPPHRRGKRLLAGIEMTARARQRITDMIRSMLGCVVEDSPAQQSKIQRIHGGPPAARTAGGIWQTRTKKAINRLRINLPLNTRL